MASPPRSRLASMRATITCGSVGARKRALRTRAHCRTRWRSDAGNPRRRAARRRGTDRTTRRRGSRRARGSGRASRRRVRRRRPGGPTSIIRTESEIGMPTAPFEHRVEERVLGVVVVVECSRGSPSSSKRYARTPSNVCVGHATGELVEAGALPRRRRGRDARARPCRTRRRRAASRRPAPRPRPRTEPLRP